MARRTRLDTGSDEGESYYVSMTDMMVGVVFIFIIMLGYFASQYHSTTSELLRTDDPKTAVLLQTATQLERSVQPVEIDYAQQVVCLPTSFLRLPVEEGRTRQDQRCFAYGEAKPDKAEIANRAAIRARSALTAQLSQAVAAPADISEVKPTDGLVSFEAERLFVEGTDSLTAAGDQIAIRLAAQLAKTLPCRGFLEGFDDYACPKADRQRVAVVNVLSRTDFDMTTEGGQAAAALAVARSVAFHRALLDAQPVLGRIRNGPPGMGADSQPLLRVATVGQSGEGAGRDAAGRTISIQIEMAP